jgi:hypothetical protein
VDLNFESNMEMRVLLLAIYKQSEEDTLLDTLHSLENNKLFSLKDGKKLLKELKNKKYLVDDRLTMVGIEKAKEVELEFRI